MPQHTRLLCHQLTGTVQCYAALQVAASPIPHLFLPGFRRSRKTLLTMLSASLAAGDFEGTVVEQLLQG